MMMMTMTRRIRPGAVKADISRSQAKRGKAEQREMFTAMYDSPQEVTFMGAASVNMDDFRAIGKDLLSRGLSQAALAIYPVLCSQADFEKDEPFQLSQANIAFLAGVSDKSVRKAMKELEKAELLTREKHTDGSRHFYVYQVKFIRKPMLESKEHRGNTIYFYTCIIDNGIWASLPLGAKAIYLFLRAEAKQDLDIYSEIEGVETGEFYEPVQYDEYIRDRKWDVCSLSLAEISKAVGVERSNMDEPLDVLERFKLVERIDRRTKVYLRPWRLLKQQE